MKPREIAMEQENKSIYDIAVVGAGPAGAVFVKELSQARPDLKIILIDGQSPDSAKPCGGLLAPDAQKLLAKFDLVLPKSVLEDPQIFAVETIDIEQKLVRYYQRHYLNMDRYAFDRWLVSTRRLWACQPMEMSVSLRSRSCGGPWTWCGVRSRRRPVRPPS